MTLKTTKNIKQLGVSSWSESCLSEPPSPESVYQPSDEMTDTDLRVMNQKNTLESA